MTTDLKNRDSGLDGDLLAELEIDNALENVPELALDLEAVMQADPKTESTGELSAYDFNRPHNISRRFAKNLQNVAELFSRNATVNLTSLLRANVVLDFQGIALRNFAEYRKNLPSPTCLAAMTLRPLGGQSLLWLELSFCFVILKKLMGGRPDSEEKVRPFTEIERGILNHFLGRLLDMLRVAAGKLIELQPELVALENNPDYIAGIPEGETMAIMRFRIRLEAVEAGMDLALPLSAFTPVRDIFDPEEHVEQRSSNEVQHDRRQIMDLVQGTTSELVVRLGEKTMLLDEVLALQEGDLIMLAQPVEAPVTVLIEDQEVFLAEAGRINQNRAVKLVRKFEKE